MNPEYPADEDLRTASAVSGDGSAADASGSTSSQDTAQQIDELREAAAAARLMIRAGISGTPARLVRFYLQPFDPDTAPAHNVLVEAVELCDRGSLDPAWLRYLERNRPPTTPTEPRPASPRRAVGEWPWADALASTCRGGQAPPTYGSLHPGPNAAASLHQHGSSGQAVWTARQASTTGRGNPAPAPAVTPRGHS